MGIPFTQLVKPFGDNPSVSAESYYIRCRKPMPPLKGEGDREAVERCAPGANAADFIGVNRATCRVPPVPVGPGGRRTPKQSQPTAPKSTLSAGYCLPTKKAPLSRSFWSIFFQSKDLRRFEVVCTTPPESSIRQCIPAHPLTSQLRQTHAVACLVFIVYTGTRNMSIQF